jgi:hypothetical protein
LTSNRPAHDHRATPADLGDIGLILATQGFVVLALELPTGGLADALGRRPS